MLLLAPHAYAPAEPEWRGLARAAVLSAAVKGEVRAFPEGRQHVEDDPQNHVRHIVNPHNVTFVEPWMKVVAIAAAFLQELYPIFTARILPPSQDWRTEWTLHLRLKLREKPDTTRRGRWH
jgi:hypothetical protein